MSGTGTGNIIRYRYADAIAASAVVASLGVLADVIVIFVDGDDNDDDNDDGDDDGDDDDDDNDDEVS